MISIWMGFKKIQKMGNMHQYSAAI